MDFTYGVDGGVSYDEWIDKAAERAVAKELARRVGHTCVNERPRVG